MSNLSSKPEEDRDLAETEIPSDHSAHMGISQLRMRFLLAKAQKTAALARECGMILQPISSFVQV